MVRTGHPYATHVLGMAFDRLFGQLSYQVMPIFSYSSCSYFRWLSVVLCCLLMLASDHCFGANLLRCATLINSESSVAGSDMSISVVIILLAASSIPSTRYRTLFSFSASVGPSTTFTNRSQQHQMASDLPWTLKAVATLEGDRSVQTYFTSEF